jgi:hypothetical protein
MLISTSCYLTPRGAGKTLSLMLTSYLDAHTMAATKHWHDEHPSDGMLFFPTGFSVTNSDEVLKKMQPLKKELSR